MKIGIYTIHNPYNFGAVLQAYATQKYLEILGHKTEIVNVISSSEEKKLNYSFYSLRNFKGNLFNLYALINWRIRQKIVRTKEFYSILNFSKRYFSIDELYLKPPKYDIHLVGSDQVWNIEKGLNKKSLFFLDFLDNKTRKISFSSSFGTEKINVDFSNDLSGLLSSFSALSVREKDGVDILKNLCGLESTQVLDPTFLFNHQYWSDLVTSDPIIKGDYILYYGFDKLNETQLMLNHLKKRFNIPVIAISASLTCPYQVDQFLSNTGPLEFLNLFKHARFVFSSSFHGVCFAIHFRKNFITIKHETRNSRFLSLLDQFGLQNRQISKLNELENFSDFDLIINYATIIPILDQKVEDSINWLQSKLHE